MRVDATGAPPAHQQSSANSGKYNGIYLGKIKETYDPKGLGRLRIWIPQLSNANESDPRGWFTMRYCPPFAGATDTKDEATARDSKTFPQTNQSYGLWMVPPTKNVMVVCGFINGDVNQGIWWACLPHDGHTHSLPGVASGATHDGKIKPVAERNRFNTADPQAENRPEHPSSFRISGQGLDNDLRRGHTNAGPFRAKDNHPGLAYGILSPGQHSIMLDDGDDGISGQIRLRTFTGHQIVMHEEGGFIHVINAKGTAWFQLDADGNIDFYAAGDFSVNAEKNINFRAGDNFNFDAGNNVNGVARNNMHIEACEVMHLTGVNGQRFTSRLNTDIYSSASMKLSANRIDLNGPVAAEAELPGENSLITNTSVGRSVAGRVPEREPWGGHTARTGGEPISTPVGVTDPQLGNQQITPSPQSYEDLPPPEKSDAVACVPDVNIDSIVMSDTAFNMMKSREAYRGMMYSDFQGYSVGYGTRIDIFGPNNPASKIDDNLKQALANGPSEAEARQASRQIIDRHITPPLRARLKSAMAGKNVCITQSMFDGLCMAAYGNPQSAYQMADQLVEAGAKAADGKPPRADIARIWANSVSANANQRNAEAQFVMTGEVPSSVRLKSPEQLMRDGIEADRQAVANARARNPAYPWRSPLGNGPQTGQRVDAAYGRPTPTQLSQWERSYYLNTGQQAPGTTLTPQQLAAKHGSPHQGGNNPPNQPTQVA